MRDEIVKKERHTTDLYTQLTNIENDDVDKTDKKKKLN